MIMDIPPKMSAAIYLGLNHVEIQEIDVPVPQAGEVLIRVKAVGLCITDVHVIQGSFAHSEPPCVLGHEIAGEIVAFGEQKWSTSLSVGDRVVVETMIACGQCEACLSGFKNLCELGGDLGEPPFQGGYCQYITVPTGCLHKIPENMTFDEAAIFESFVCPVGGLQRLGVKMGDKVLIQGLGPAGLAFVQGARAMGAAHIIVSDMHWKRLALAQKYGADTLVNPTKENLVDLVMALTNNKGVDLSLEASGNPIAIKNSVDLCRKNGKIIYYGIPSDNHNIRFDVTQIILKQLQIHGTSGAPWAWNRTLDLYGKGVYNIKDMVTHTLPLAQICEGIQLLSAPTSQAIKVVLHP